MVRAFLAIDLPAELKKKLYQLSYITPPSSLKIKWVEEPNFHITLKFFGDISENFLKKIFKESEKVVKEYVNFKLTIDTTGYFSEKGMPRVVWIGLKLETQQLFNLYQGLEKVFKKLKISDSKEKFHPHITLFRIKNLGNKGDFKEFFNKISQEAEGLKGFNFLVKELTFFKSTLTPKGPIYEPLYKVGLKDG
jgi:2'-5' RNA ligase